MKAIETRYKGCKFRSRLEARWVVFFDALNVKWEYEHEGYKLSTGEQYLPDFWLPEYDIYIEIKGKWPDEQYINMMRTFAYEKGQTIAMFTGLPSECKGMLFVWAYDDDSCTFIETDARPEIIQTIKGVSDSIEDMYPKITPINIGDDISAIFAFGSEVCCREPRYVYVGNYIFPYHRVPITHVHDYEEWPLTDGDNLLLRAFNKAKSARFEFGEEG